MKLGRHFVYVIVTEREIPPDRLKLLKDGGVFVGKSPKKREKKEEVSKQ